MWPPNDRFVDGTAEIRLEDLPRCYARSRTRTLLMLVFFLAAAALLTVVRFN